MTEEMQRVWKVIHVIELARFYCDTLDNPSGGNLHIVLSDGNIQTADVEFCREEARNARDHVGLALAELLLELTEEERQEVYVALLPPGHSEREERAGAEGAD